MKKIKILLIVDAQNDFISGSLRNNESLEACPKIIDKIKAFDGDAIITTYDTHADKYLNTREGHNLPIEHCIKGTDGWQLESHIAQAIAESKKEHICIYKNTFGSVQNSEGQDTNLVSCLYGWMQRAEQIGFDIDICGFCTDICVVSNALILKAHFYENADIKVDSKCCAGTTEENHEAALKVMQSCQIEVY